MTGENYKQLGNLPPTSANTHGDSDTRSTSEDPEGNTEDVKPAILPGESTWGNSWKKAAMGSPEMVDEEACRGCDGPDGNHTF